MERRFAGSRGPGGLTKLSAWWLKLGIEPHLIRPASPQENGRHERMHRTLKAQTSRPPAASRAEQQIRFDHFRRHYNEERPHQALDQRLPAELYSASPRPMPERLEDPWYDADHRVRRVRSNGEVMWKGELLFISEALIGELIGIAEMETGDQVVRFCHFDIGLINRLGQFRRWLRLATGSAARRNWPKSQNRRVSSGFKMSVINPVEQRIFPSPPPSPRKRLSYAHISIADMVGGLIPWVKCPKFAEADVTIEFGLGRFGDRRLQKGGPPCMRRLSSGPARVSVTRRLAGRREQEVRFTRFLRNHAVTAGEMVCHAATGTAARVADRDVVVVQDTSELTLGGRWHRGERLWSGRRGWRAGRIAAARRPWCWRSEAMPCSAWSKPRFGTGPMARLCHDVRVQRATRNRSAGSTWQGAPVMCWVRRRASLSYRTGKAIFTSTLRGALRMRI